MNVIPSKLERIYESDDYQDGASYSTQVCIIGSGCGGATLAKRLTDFGVDVIVLEQGSYVPAAKMDQREINMVGRLYADRGFGTATDSSTTLLHGNNVGGASVHYWADSYRTPQDKIDSWQQEYGIKGHGLAELNPAFDQIEKSLNIHEATDPYFNVINQKIRGASKTLSWHGHRVPQARKNCTASGHCMHGCLYDAKQSQMITHIPAAIKQGARVFANARAGKLVHQDRRVKHVRVDIMDPVLNKPSGKTITINADVVAVASGGYSSSYYLMQQGFKKQLPALGKYFSMNPSTMVHSLFDEDIIQWRNIPAAWGIDEYRQRRYQEGQYKEGGYLLMPNQLHPPTLAGMIPGFGEKHQDWMMNAPKIGGTISWIDDIEDELGEIRLKSNGAREVHYPYGETTQKVLKDSLEKQVILNFEMGAKKVLIAGVQGIELSSINEMKRLGDVMLTSAGLFLASPHPGGGCRMGEDPKISVVNSEHKVHGWDNLFVSDSSVFPSSSSLDPSLSIMGFSYIAADRIVENLKTN
ncbi:MAG: GMC family oxidoreductase [Pseudomonadales bacterium]|nr:GMC family oxidoreductase [Pseudomonadales bacterium]